MDETVRSLADAWEADAATAFAPHAELTPDGPRMPTRLYVQVLDEVLRRHEERAERQRDVLARAEGFRNVRHALKKLATMPAAEAGPIYLRIFRRRV